MLSQFKRCMTLSRVEYIKLVDLWYSRHDSTTHSRAGIHDDTQYRCGRGMPHSRAEAGRTLVLSFLFLPVRPGSDQQSTKRPAKHEPMKGGCILDTDKLYQIGNRFISRLCPGYVFW